MATTDLVLLPPEPSPLHQAVIDACEEVSDDECCGDYPNCSSDCSCSNNGGGGGGCV